MKLDVIVSLTSWKARINYVSRTIFSIIKNCEPLKIVLCLAETEFPNKESELPEDLLVLINNELVEILWVKENTFCFKKILYTLDKYKEYPIVSADDDCIYHENYVKILYDKWLTEQTTIWTYKRHRQHRHNFGHGPACIYPPYCFMQYGLKFLTQNIIKTYHDDVYYGVLARKLHISIKQVMNNNSHIPYTFHDEIKPLHTSKSISILSAVKIDEREIKL